MSDSTNEVGTVVFEIVVLFETILAKTSSVVALQAQEMDEFQLTSKTPRGNSRAPDNNHHPSSQDHHAICQNLAQLAVAIVTDLDPSKKSHSQILEGCLFIFLNHLGCSLSLAVFAETQPQQRETLTGLIPPKGLQDISKLRSETSLRTVPLEAPYLIYILDKLMTFIDDYQALDKVQANYVFSGFRDNMTSNDLFAVQIKEKLQNTLLKGVFGDDDETFRNALQKPERPESGVDEDSSLQVGPAEKTHEWFIGEVWRAIGWNILAGSESSL